MRAGVKGLALVCLVAGGPTDQIGGSFYLAADTCLNQLARLARLIPRETQIHVFYEHTAAKWSGRGCQAPAESRSSFPRAVVRKKGASKKR